MVNEGTRGAPVALALARAATLATTPSFGVALGLILCAGGLACTGRTGGGTDGATGPSDAAGSDAGSDAAPSDAGPPPPADFTCLGMNAPPPPTNPTATVTFTVGEAVSPMAPESGVTVEAFARADLAGAMVLASALSDATGASLVLPLGFSGFDGYLRLSGMAGSMLRTTYYYQDKAITQDGDLGALVIISETSWALLPSVANAPQSPMLGAVGLQLLDCAGIAVPGAVLGLSATDPLTAIRYVSGGIPNENATATDASGSLVVFNAPVGPLTLTLDAPPAPGMAPVPVGAITLDVRADALTVASVTPLP